MGTKRSAPGVLCGVALGCAVACGVARAQPELAFDVRVDAPVDSGCPDAERLTQRVEERVGRSAASGGPRTAVVVQIEQVSPGYRARVQVADGGSRVLEAPGDCASLEEMLVLVIGSSVGVSAALPAPPPLAAEPAPAIETEREQPVSWSAAPAAPSRPWRPSLELAGRLATGLAPVASAEAGLGLWLDHGALGLRLAALFLPASSPGEEARVRITGGLVELDACAAAAQGAHASLSFCAGVQAGALRASAASLWQSTPRWDGVLLLAPGVWLRLHLLARLGLTLGLGASVPLLAPRYTYADQAGHALALHSPGLGVFGEVACSLRFGP